MGYSSVSRDTASSTSVMGNDLIDMGQCRYPEGLDLCRSYPSPTMCERLVIERPLWHVVAIHDNKPVAKLQLNDVEHAAPFVRRDTRHANIVGLPPKIGTMLRMEGRRLQLSWGASSRAH